MADANEIPPGQPDKSEPEEESKEEPTPMKAKAPMKAKSKTAPKSKPKASPKNKAVVSAKAKAKVKAKAAPKSTIQKKPSKAPVTPMKKTQKAIPSAPVKPSKSKAEEDKEGQKNKNMKRPASKNEPEKRNLFGGLPPPKPETEKEDQEMGEEEKDFEDDMEIEQNTETNEQDKKTDRCKKQKFMSMLAGNQLPDFVKKQWESTKTMKTGRTEAQRCIINAAFDRSAQGKLILSLEKPVFQSARAQYQDKTSSAIEKSLPRSLFMGKFNLSPQMFQEGLAAGDFQEVDVGGRPQYTWSSRESKITRGDRTEVGLKAEIQGKKDDGAKFQSMLKNNWSQGLFNQTPAIGAGSAGSAQGQGQLALMDQQQALTDEQWNAAQGQLLPAMQAFEKCEKEGLKSLQVVGNDSKDDPLYTTLQLGWQFSYMR